MSLNELSISNLIFIERLNLAFTPGFNIITGETGAGKSILLGALSLVLGQKVSPRTYIQKGASQATVSAVFSPGESEKLKRYLESLGIAPNRELIVRRTLYRTNTTKCWINDQPVTLQTLQEVGDHLVDIHGQNQHQTFLKKSLHLQLLDILGNHQETLYTYNTAYRKLKELEKRRQELEQTQQSRVRELDMLRYQDNEISRHNLNAGRDIELEQERNMLKNAHEIKQQASHLMELLYNGETSVFSILSEISPNIEHFSSDTGQHQIQENHQIILTLTEEIFRDINSTGEKVDINPEKLDEIEEELNTLYQLKRKYGSSIEDILSYQEKIQEDINALTSEDNSLEHIQEEIVRIGEFLRNTARELTCKRKNLASKLEKDVNRELKTLAFTHPRFSIHIEELERPGPHGQEDIEFYISTNPDRSPQPLKEVASGGEISRIMLALKTVFARADQVPTMVFDEVDSGIGSITAHKVGQALKKLSSNHQVLCITHLPQIAIKADHHLVVDKSFHREETIVTVRHLETREEQEKEITRLLGLDNTEQGSRQVARDLLNEFHARPE